MAALDEISRDGFYEELEVITGRIVGAIEAAAESAGCPVRVNHVGSMFCPYFSGEEVNSLADVMGTDRERHKVFFHALLEEGVMPAPSPFEAWFSSSAHDSEAVEKTSKAAFKAFEAALGA